MRVIIDTGKIKKNILKAEGLSKGKDISLMFKDFYEDLFYKIAPIKNRVFSLNIENSICYSLGKSTYRHSGAVVSSINNMPFNATCVYIPINAYDNREGLCVDDVVALSKEIKRLFNQCEIYGMITSGCLNERCPSLSDLNEIWSKLQKNILSISLGGSFWLGKNIILPKFVSDIRIGEYMLFGTIPYSNNNTFLGQNAILIEAEIIGIFPDRGQVILDCGYTMADMDKCKVLSHNLYYIDSSSEYSIFNAEMKDVKMGDKVLLEPNYKSLVKLRYAVRNYI